MVEGWPWFEGTSLMGGLWELDKQSTRTLFLFLTVLLNRAHPHLETQPQNSNQ
jgi:hypothetical protein